jgi:hypothetical protein
MKKEYDYYKLYVEDGNSCRYVVKGFGSYPKSSVNYGMTRIVYLDCFDTEEEARAAYPDLSYGNKFLDTQDMPSTAPSWFDPTAAGEVWGEDDY